MNESTNQQTPKFHDTSTAARSIKAERFLISLTSDWCSPHFFADGFPRPEIRQDAAATLAVLREMAAALAMYAATDRDALQTELFAKIKQHQCCSEDLIALRAVLRSLENGG